MMDVLTVLALDTQSGGWFVPAIIAILVVPVAIWAVWFLYKVFSSLGEFG